LAPVLGVMTLYLNDRKMEERQFFKKLIFEGKKLGIDVFVFTPQDVDSNNRRIYAHDYNPNRRKWTRKWTDFPALIFDRCRYQPTERFKQLRQFRAKYPDLTYLNRPLANKWEIHKLYSKNERIRPYLPETSIYSGSSDLFSGLRKHRVVYIKPINGTGGRGIMRIERLSSGRYMIQGRDQQRRIIKPVKLGKAGLVARVRRLKVNRQYLIQQGIDLKLNTGRVHDYRLLIQKNGRGEWEVTGCAGRVGARNSITSNLHGGGHAVSMERLLRQYLSSEEKIQLARRTAYELAHNAAKNVESHYGELCELALDIAVDRDGHLWLLEINPKPGREVFGQIDEEETYRKAIVRPLEYAIWLSRQKKAE
jgi:glutathione synthase/RimK-type ligase-like ATP-grasp enzyme